jgi:3-methyladenine DNA glycosylase AlkD
MEELAAELERRLREVATPERAEPEKRYLKSDLDFLGVSMGLIRDAVKGTAHDHPEMTHDELLMLVDALWAKPLFERRMASVLMLDRFHDLIGVADVAAVERLVRESRTWALVDPIATDVLGGLIRRHPDAMRPLMDRWAIDADFWVRRAALLAELRPIRGGAPIARFLRRAEPMLEEREFFIRKAIGWVLREAGRRRPDEVAAWLGPRTHRASGVTMREAVKHLPPGEADLLMAAYREGRPAA